MIVVLPAPLWPSRPVTPGPTVNDTSAGATVSPSQRETPSKTSGGPPAPPEDPAPPAPRTLRLVRGGSTDA